MARLLYLDCFSGISGDMLLGAMLDAGLPLDELRRALGSLAIEGVGIQAERVLRAGVSATKFQVVEGGLPAAGHDHPHLNNHSQDHDHLHEHEHRHEHDDDHGHQHRHDHGHHPHRSLPDIFTLIDRSALSHAGRDRAKGLFQQLAEVEASIHQMPVDQVHLHEVGALDSIIDIVGAVFALEWAAADEIVCSPLNVGGGMVDAAHGHFPVPAPATLKLLTRREVPVYSGRVQQELVTPTGALIATAYAGSFGPLPAMTVECVGYGAGDRDPAGTPNVLRVVLGRAAERRAGEQVVVLECEIDDMNPQIFGVVMDQLYAAGALEVFYVPVQMKKNRPGILMTVIAPPELRPVLSGIIFRETTTIGLRFSEVEREVLAREITTVETPAGRVRVKLAWHEGAVVNAVPEFEDCARLARANQLPVKAVQAMAVEAYAAGKSGPAPGRLPPLTDVERPHS